MICLVCAAELPPAALTQPRSGPGGRRKYCSKRYKQTAAQRKYLYGTTAEQVYALMSTQGRRCALCPRPATDVDHDHHDDRIRGMLCRSCNVSLGQLGDTIISLQRALDYLQHGFRPG